MSQNLSFDFSVNKEARTIEVKREFAAERSLVWDAYTKSEILDQWWGPKPWNAKTKSMDFREGGRWLYSMVGPAGEEHWSVADYLSIDAPKSFTGLDAFSDAEGNINKEMGQSKWKVTFTDKGDRTLVEIHISFDDLAQLETMLAMGFKEGLGTGMDQLDALLPTLKK